MRESVEITMLGKFTIFGPGMAGPKAVSLTGRARRLWILTAYLILNRERGVSARELIDLLWPDSESSDPMATLQNNVSRARNALEELGLRDGKKLICNRSGTYYWAPNTETVLDCEQFRTALRACLDEVGNIKDEALAARAIGMYSDDFLPECATDSWCVNTNAYYHASYLQLCRKMTAHLLDRQAYAEVGQICRRVLGLDPAAEEFAVRLMQALTRSGMPDKALEYYDYISKLYLESLRMGDPFTRMGADCILIMLAGADDNGAAVVEKRVCRNYRQTYSVPASAFVFRSMDLKRLGQKII